MRLHERTQIVQVARDELGGFLIDLERKHNLTYAEMFSLLGGQISDLAKHAIRSERHPDDHNKKGDEA
jgi:hypothetical protein